MGSRTGIARVRGLGPYPSIASFHHGSFYFTTSAFSGTRVLFVESSDVAIVRGDGRRNTYRWNGSSFDAAAGLGNSSLSLSAGVYTETTPSGTLLLYDASVAANRYKLTKIVDRYGNPVYYTYDANQRLQLLDGLPSAGSAGLVPYLAYNASGFLNNLTLLDRYPTYMTFDLRGQLST